MSEQYLGQLHICRIVLNDQNIGHLAPPQCGIKIGPISTSIRNWRGWRKYCCAIAKGSMRFGDGRGMCGSAHRAPAIVGCGQCIFASRGQGRRLAL
jgi:hypothetical protein